MRRDCREVAFKKIFSDMFEKENDIKEDIFEFDVLKDEDKEYTLKLIETVKSNYDFLTSEIDSISINFHLDRIFNVDKAILLLAMAEIKFIDEVPAVVSIKEAIELVKKYSQEGNVVFINGILAKFKQNTENE